MRKLPALLVAVALAAAGCGGGGGEKSAEPTGNETVASGQVPFDQAFIDAMVPHHLEAIEMARAAKRAGLMQPDLNRIATDIVAVQKTEIDQLLAWREQWFGSRKRGPVLPEVLGVPEDEMGMEHGSADEVANANDVDATFAEMMIAHHEGAIRMAESAKERAQHQQVKDMAVAIVEAQQREINIMRKHASGEHHG
jgi:uncharacterized protein (DUF305 family)